MVCLPRFDLPACFAALLGAPENGRWLIAPADPAYRVERRYLDGSLVLVTTFETTEGAVEVIDFFRPRQGPLHLVRLVRGVRGRLAMQVEVILRFDRSRPRDRTSRLGASGGDSGPTRRC